MEHTVWVLLSFIFMFTTVMVKTQPTMVDCYSTALCDDSMEGPVLATLDDCCNHNAAPIGFTYQLQGSTLCQTCPIVYGFLESTFVGEEAGNPHTVQVGFLSGRRSNTVVYRASLVLGTAKASDVTLIRSIGRTLLNTIAPDPVTFTLVVDAVAQEVAETFTLELSISDGLLPPDAVIRREINCTIIDVDAVTFSFTENDYRRVESESMPVTVSKTQDVLLANPVMFRVTPLTIEQGLERGIIESFENEIAASPNRAKEDDFDTRVLTLTFPADEGLQARIVDVLVPIPLVDDAIDEAESQFFLVYLEAVTSDVTITRRVSTCQIVDNDAIRIGFALPLYRFQEPANESLTTEVTLVKEGNRESEQTFGVVVTVSDPGGILQAASIQASNESIYDYRLFIPSTFILLLFPSAVQSVTFSFFINADELPEGTEAFRASSTPFEGFATFQAPITDSAHQTTTIEILDNDFSTVGFEFDEYFVNETDGAVQVCVLVFNPPSTEALVFTIFLVYESRTGTAGSEDFTEIGESQGFVLFQSSTPANTLRRECFDVFITDDNLVEEVETFTLELALDSFEVQSGVLVVQNQTTISIVDDDEPASTGVLVNDTIIGDPLFTVPILVAEEQLRSLGLTRVSLCYEIHGESGQWFNLVTDECTTVNAQYSGLSRSLNIIDEVGVRAVDDSNQCVNIHVDINECAAEVNGVSLNLLESYSRNGINVKRYANRVRISVPNCNELTLVMWALCEVRTLYNPDVRNTKIEANMIKFVVMRGLNFGRAAHGLLGQFWNSPASIAPFVGRLTNGRRTVNAYVVNITTSTDTRSFAGWLHPLTWDRENGPCIYVGNKQAGEVVEFSKPNDRVIEDVYKEYQVSGGFSEEEYKFGRFQEERCT